MIFYLGNKENKVPEKVRVANNKIKSWKYGYSQEYDVIIISKDGTLGDIYRINGIFIGLPEPPKNREEILNWDKTESNQRWERKELPEGLTKKTQYNPKYKEFILEEIKLRKHGKWIYLKGELVYMPGLSYYLYQWNRLDDGYPNFRVIQNELIIYWEACKADHRCYGICYVKNRRFGWSTICNTEQLYTATQYKNKKLGIVSKTNDDAKEMFNMAFDVFKRLPPFFQPSWDDKTQSRIVLKKSTTKGAEDDIDEGIDSYIRYYSTALNSMDGGKKVFRSSLDEVGKFPKEVPFDKYWRIVKTSHRQGVRIVGKAMVGSTVNALKKGGAEFQLIFNQSDTEIERNKNNETSSGLYALFIPAKYGLEGKYDTYGFSIVEDPEKPILTDEGIYTDVGTISYLKNEAEPFKINNDLEGEYELKRQFPDTLKDAFRDESGECDFNGIKIDQQIDYNTYDNNHDKNGSDNIERGNFTWKDGIQDTEVIWRPNPQNGRFWIAKDCHPPLEYRNQKEMRMKNGVMAWSPMAAHIGCFGVDPYNRSKTASGDGSKGSIHLQTQYNTSTLPNDAYILEYITKAPTVELFFEDVLMAMVYYSIPMLSELSNEAFLKMIKNRGYRHFSLNNPFKLFKDLSPTEKELGGAPPQDAKIGVQQFYAIETYIEDHVGIANDTSKRPIGTIGFMPFNRTLTQWSKVDTNNRTKYDAYISSSLAALGNQRRTVKKVEKKPIRNPFTTYNNEGTISKAI